MIPPPSEHVRSLPEVDETLWQHVLFEQPASYPVPGIPLLAAQMDARIRRLRRMPSTGDRASEDARGALEELYDSLRGVLLDRRTPCPRSLEASLDLLRRIHRVMEALRGERVGPREIRLLDHLLPALYRARLLTSRLKPSDTVGTALEALCTAERLLLDRTALLHPATARSYPRRVYRVMTGALDYNVTADPARIAPVLAWVAEWLARQPARPHAYVDVGCSMATGAANTHLAARMLRPAGCTAIHGVDIVAPDRGLQRAALRESGVLLYQADVVGHPLPRRYDLVLLANVHRHLTRPDQQQMLRHLAASLTPGGRIYLNWRFDARNSPALQLGVKANRLVVMEERNCATFQSA